LNALSLAHKVQGPSKNNPSQAARGSLTGFSEITRCAKTVAVEGVSLAPVWDDSDTYCLDGVHLIPDAQHYFFVPTNDPLTTIRATKFVGSQPSEWEQRARDGTVRTFGGTGATLMGTLNTGATATHSWRIRDERDRHDNHVIYEYASVPPSTPNCADLVCNSAELIPVRVRYTTSASDPSGHKSVELSYTNLSAPEQYFVAGLGLKVTQRLSAITVRGPMPRLPGVVRRYQLSYATSATSGDDLLTSIQECSGTGWCKKPIALEYQAGQDSFTAGPALGGSGLTTPGDINGDGRDDVIFQPSFLCSTDRGAGTGNHSRERPMKSLSIRVLLTCPLGAAECLVKLREVLEAIEIAHATGATEASWQQNLPSWFITACANPMSPDEAQAYVDRWRKMSKDEQAETTKNQQWSLPDWLYWMAPNQSTWRWIDARVTASNELEVTLSVDGWPVALGAFDWLARASGASVVRVIE
jgi:hypothetical protein